MRLDHRHQAVEQIPAAAAKARFLSRQPPRELVDPIDEEVDAPLAAPVRVRRVDSEKVDALIGEAALEDSLIAGVVEVFPWMVVEGEVGEFSRRPLDVRGIDV